MNTSESAPKTAETEPTRVPLGCRDKDGINHTLLRVVGREEDALDVAAFQSFVN